MRTPFATLTPDPPNVSCVVFDHLSPSGPSRYPCPRVDTPPQSLPSTLLNYTINMKPTLWGRLLFAVPDQAVRFLLKLTIITPPNTMTVANTFCHVSTSIPMMMLTTIAIIGWT